MVFSFGNKLVIFFHKVIPPIPESKKPIGYEAPPSFQTRPSFYDRLGLGLGFGRLEQGKRCLGSNYRREVETTILGGAAPHGLADVVED